VTRTDVDRWYDRLPDDRSTYRARAYSLLRAVLATATDDDVFAKNPARIRGAGQAERRHEPRPASLDELDALTTAMPPRYRLLVQLAAWCALRFGELTELRREDVELTRVDVAAPEGDGTVSVATDVLRVRRAVVLVLPNLRGVRVDIDEIERTLRRVPIDPSPPVPKAQAQTPAHLDGVSAWYVAGRPPSRTRWSLTSTWAARVARSARPGTASADARRSRRGVRHLTAAAAGSPGGASSNRRCRSAEGPVP